MIRVRNLMALLGATALGAMACQPHHGQPARHGGPPPPPQTAAPGAQPAPAQVALAPAAPFEPTPAPTSPPRTEGIGKDSAIPTCGPRDSYRYVASDFRCADGSNPFHGDLHAAASSRRGNVGPNAAGQVIDLYDVPCPEGNQEVFVNMYAGCDEEQSPLRT